MGKKHDARIRTKRQIVQGDGVLYIPLSNGDVATIDDTPEARSIAEGRNWVFHLGYARAHFAQAGGGYKSMLLHRVLLPGHPMIDHINGNKLDCRLANLRPCTPARNKRNGAGWSASGLKGAYRSRSVVKGKVYEYWHSSITHNGVSRYLGRFSTAEEAHRAWLAASLEVDPEFTCAGR